MNLAHPTIRRRALVLGHALLTAQSWIAGKPDTPSDSTLASHQRTILALLKASVSPKATLMEIEISCRAASFALSLFMHGRSDSEDAKTTGHGKKIQCLSMALSEIDHVLFPHEAESLSPKRIESLLKEPLLSNEEEDIHRLAKIQEEIDRAGEAAGDLLLHMDSRTERISQVLSPDSEKIPGEPS